MTTEHCDYVKLVLARMDTNPEEFVESSKLASGNFGYEMRQIHLGNKDHSYWILTDEEQQALLTKYRALKRDSMKEQYLESILNKGTAGKYGDSISFNGYLTPPAIAKGQVLTGGGGGGGTFNGAMNSVAAQQQAQNAMLNTGNSWQAMDPRDLFKDSK